MNDEIPISMRPRDLLLYLIGSRGAIERIAATRGAWLVGAILVLSAGIARNYDHLDLLRQPKWIIGPFGASLASTGLIFIWVSLALRLHQVGHYRRQLGTFLVLAWMTAPCAWLYGIPVEGMTDLMTATKWNIAFLAIVALWRVALIVRAVSVLTGIHWLRVLPLVLAPAALEALVGSFFKKLSLINVMGGIRLPPSTLLLQKAAEITMTGSLVLLAICVIGSFMARPARKPLDRPKTTVLRSTPAIAAMSLLAWAGVAIPMHPQVANLGHLTSLIRQNDLPAAVAFASGKTREDFPRNQLLPPEPPWFRFKLLDLLPADAPLWLKEEWTRNAAETLRQSSYGPNDEDQTIIRNHPELRDVIPRQIEVLRNQSTPLAEEDREWLNAHEKVPENPQISPPATPPSP